MLFNSFQFLLFLPIVFIVYWLLSAKYKWQNLLIVISSYVFYGWWNPWLTILIFSITICSYLCGRAIVKWRNRARTFLVINIVVNLSVLSYFKYMNFFMSNLVTLVHQIGYELDWVTLEVLLPVGISFYTFQAISYTVDLYRATKREEPVSHIFTKDIMAFMAYLSFFPQLVAGPIERASDLLPQFRKPRRFDYDNCVSGLRMMLWGFFKKLVIADNCAFFVNNIYAETDSTPWVRVVSFFLFSFQIYCDFSGYSDIAVGTSRLFSIRLTQNFRSPFFSRNIGDLWRRWHISLNRWFRDYVFIPLGGSKKGTFRTILNIVIIFVLSGIWHGAEWTFVAWGLFNAVLMILWYVLFNHRDKKLTDSRLAIRDYLGIFTTYLSFVIGVGLLFRADNLNQTAELFSNLVNGDWRVLPGVLWFDIRLRYTAILCVVLLVSEYFTLNLSCPLNSLERAPGIVRWTTYLFIGLIIFSFTGKTKEFIYFRF